MRLESALHASKEALISEGQAIANSGDNIANANTTGYKSSRVEFSDLLAEGGEGHNSTSLPVNGSGVKVSRVRTIHDTGVIEFTGRTLDAAIAGNGYFMVGDASAPSYTRAGNFSVNEDGVLVNSDGLPLIGYTGSSSTLGVLDTNNLDITGSQSTKIEMFGNVDASSEITSLPGTPTRFKDIGSTATFLVQSSAYDSLGIEHGITMGFYKTGTNTWIVRSFMDGADVGGTEGVPVQIGADTTLTFGNDGQIAEASKAAAVITATPAYSNGAATGNFTIDLSDFTQFGGTSSLKAVTNDGKGTGNVKDFEFREDGSFYAVLDSGTSSLIGSLAIADFPNREGLDRAGNTLFVSTQTSGDATVGKPGSGSLGDLAGGALERSTVDIANQFVELILYQRAYQASSQVLNAANTTLRDTIQLMR